MSKMTKIIGLDMLFGQTLPGKLCRNIQYHAVQQTRGITHASYPCLI